MKEPCLKRLDYDYDEYFYDDNRYEDDDSDYINPDNLERIQGLYGIDNTRRLRYLFNREECWMLELNPVVFISNSVSNLRSL